jgi:XTP/dITP diphosphohydrolase
MLYDMKQILFATGNKHKLGEAKLACDMFDIAIKQLSLDIDEIQSHEPIKIARHKAAAAFSLAQRPLAVTDTSWHIPALKGFPGGYMKDVVQWFEPTDFMHLMHSKKDKRVYFTETVIYVDATQTKVFSRKFEGTFAASPRGSGNTIEEVVEFNGLTIAELHEQGKFTHKPEDYVWFDFATWFSQL